MNGSAFGPFLVLEKLGEGGMGEVYRARDSRLNRDVALKVLPQTLSADPERLARFTREAQVLASLNHPNIGAIYGLEEQHAESGARATALVLELVEGPTLADRIAQGALPIDEALPIARQVADALEAAHEQGIVHRDLKPANIKLRIDGTVKVLDFGLAKSVTAVEMPAATSSIMATFAGPDTTATPTLTSPALLTGAGMLLGTAAYMAPEQARGKPADRRSDVWAFGCVLFEMLAGRRPFAADDVADTLAAILRAEPAWSDLPADTPPAIRRLLRRSLQKDPRERLHSIADARLEIADALSRREEVPQSAPSIEPRNRSSVPVAMAAAGAAILAGGLTWWFKPAPPAPDLRATRALISLEPFDYRKPLPNAPPFPRLPRPDRTTVALSPDGRTLVFRAWVFNATPNGGTQSQLFVRPLDSLNATPIDTTTGADTPFFSPDGAWIAYWDGGELRRVPASGGNAAFTTITAIPQGARITGATWGDADSIAFATTAGVWQVSAQGGTPALVARVGAEENARILPQFLPGGESLLLTVQKAAYRWDDAEVVVRTLRDGAEKVLLTDAADARYVSTGHLLFMRRGKLMAVGFDREQLELTGAPVAIVDDVMQAAGMGNTIADSGAGQFAVAAQGTLVYVTGGMQRNDPTELVWIDRDTGAALPVKTPLATYGGPRLSPDGQRILMFSGASPYEGGNRLWMLDVQRGTHTAVSARDERILWGAWSPDGRHAVYEKLDAGRGTLHMTRIDSDGAGEPIAEGRAAFQSPGSWASTGRLAFVESTGGGTEIRVLDMNASNRADSIAVQTSGNNYFPEFSPDGQWLAYASDTSGRWEVYVQPFPGPGSRLTISTAGGVAPTWRGDGRELYYYAAGNGQLRMYAVPITVTGGTFAAGTPRQLFVLEGRYSTTSPLRGYDVTRDGKRFLFFRSGDPPPLPPPQMVLVEHWSKELTRRDGVEQR